MSENYIDFKTITIYPTIAYMLFLFCKQYYKYILHYNLLVLDMYDNTYDYEPINKETNNKETQTDAESEYYNNVLIAFNQNPT
jgi:hypothetical protein